ncbi:hypothetical protein NBRC116601_33550 [Cognatishimia sp. WU-CL00825]|uniref:hypothetical protein n=1 Tax=Cognatishimia sp. WU-CL00825 TaxID=3127658 RepID=UPI00310733E6
MGGVIRRKCLTRIGEIQSIGSESQAPCASLWYGQAKLLGIFDVLDLGLKEMYLRKTAMRLGGLGWIRSAALGLLICASGACAHHAAVAPVAAPATGAAQTKIPAGAQTETLTGRVIDTGLVCPVVQSESGAELSLKFPPHMLQEGDRLQIVGRFDPEAYSNCDRGQEFIWQHIRLLDADNNVAKTWDFP